MPSIGDLNYGYDKAGVDQYIDNIKGIVLTEACEQIRDISSIESVCDQEWEGQAKENFKTNLKTDAEHLCKQFEFLYNVLTSEINSVQAAMSNKDEELIKIN